MDSNKAALIQDMKRRMQQRPSDVSEAEWASVEANSTLEAHHGAIESVKGAIVSKAVQQLAAGLPDDNKATVESLFNLSVYEFLRLLNDPKTKDNVKAQMTMYIMDHTIGKPKQEIEHSGSLALEIRAQARKALELEKASGMRDVSPTKQMDKSAQVIDDFLSKHMPDGFVVGKKATTNGNVEE